MLEGRFSAAESQTPHAAAQPAVLAKRPAGLAWWSAMGRPGAGGGKPVSLQFMNKRNYSEHTHPQPESSWSKAYFEFIWCAIHYLLKMKKNDFYCTELLHIVIYLSAFCLKQTKKIKNKKKRQKENEKGEKRNYRTKAAPCHFHVSCWWESGFTNGSPNASIHTVLLIIFHRDVAMTLGYKAPFLSDHRKLDT